MNALRHLLYRCLQIGVVLVGMALGSALQRAPGAQTLGLHLGTAHSSPTYTVTGPVLDRDTLQPIGMYTQQRRYESFNPGLYLRLDSGATAGFYRNSYGRWSTYAGWTWQTAGDRFALTVGAVTGYPTRSVSPLIVPSVRFDLAGATSARLSLLPKTPGTAESTGLHLSLERRF